MESSPARRHGRTLIQRIRRQPPSCCAACIAAAGGPHRERAQNAAGRLWIGLVCLGGALVPLAALSADHDEPTAAAAATAGPVIRSESGLNPLRVSKGLAEEPGDRPAIEWRRSRALGTANSGRLVDGVLLPARGPGFYTYNPATQTPPGGADRQWGTDRLVRALLSLGQWWARSHPNQPRLGIGDLSRPQGGPFPGPGVGHASHQNGLDVDIRLPRRDGVEGPATAANYDRELTQQLVNRLLAQGAELILIGENLDLRGPAGVVVRWPAHDDHLHVRFPNPG